jgi:hypothetical protein
MRRTRARIRRRLSGHSRSARRRQLFRQALDSSSAGSARQARTAHSSDISRLPRPRGRDGRRTRRAPRVVPGSPRELPLHLDSAPARPFHRSPLRAQPSGPHRPAQHRPRPDSLRGRNASTGAQSSIHRPEPPDLHVAADHAEHPHPPPCRPDRQQLIHCCCSRRPTLSRNPCRSRPRRRAPRITIDHFLQVPARSAFVSSRFPNLFSITHLKKAVLVVVSYFIHCAPTSL